MGLIGTVCVLEFFKHFVDSASLLNWILCVISYARNLAIAVKSSLGGFPCIFCDRPNGCKNQSKINSIMV